MSDSLSHLIVKGTLVTLVLFSVLTWALVLAKGLQVARARRKDARFLEAVDPASRLPSSEQVAKFEGPTARVAAAFASLWEQLGVGPKASQIEVVRDVLELSLKKQIQRERHTTEAGLAVLASIGTTSPFVGLFGTVWGIMHALKRISGAGSASLDVVAGPIGEALVATGVGIAVAVPAVLAYNFFVRRLKVQGANLDDFANSLVLSALGKSLGSNEHSSEHTVSRLADRSASTLREARV
ncbi:MAG: MotA/TolQ/ExbB proton channel family protein [Polyangiaceae bacterium]